ncbi:pectin lyase fold virulence factor [Trichoderma arundinaceum]|uniref:Pectin lyase fold virulence factor n=1 Tax=Trichoderma arundinaceum TaxID=490622 RepID=A0A395NJ92_TRIAR|nr:pectin lyase fold virulence factor [Trichoderma arundinaceum]
MESLRFLLYLTAFLTIPLLRPHQQGFVVAQFFQDYQWRYIGSANSNAFTRQPFWQPNLPEPYQQGILLDPESVFLEYNCYYMKEICRNANDFINSPRGQSRPEPMTFGYDLNNKVRKPRRRERSCPTAPKGSAWKDFHTCPEPDQKKPMKQNGEWQETDLEPGVNNTNNQIKNKRDSQGNVIEYSKIRYSCDEFPPATWIEGGSDVTTAGSPLNHGNALTRCAAIRCGVGVKAEQDWQGTSHGELRKELIAVTKRRQADYGHFSWFVQSNSFVLFRFRMINTPNNLAAQVITYEDPALTQISNTRVITQGKRSQLEDEHRRWLNSVTTEELLATGKAKARHIYANETLAAMNLRDGFVMSSMGVGMNATESQFIHRYLENEDDDYEYEDEGLDERSSDGLNRAYSAWTARSANQDSSPVVKENTGQELKGRSDTNFTPLLKDASTEDIENARKIVEDAITKSTRLNKARLAKPLRNKYELEPGTMLGDSTSNRRSRRRRDSDEVPPLLEITDEIAAAAALVTEAEAEGLISNITRRAASASGTYWMEHIDRKGTVPWGNDQGYKIFRNVLDYGATGNGVTDDTKAIKSAMTDGTRCGVKCNGSTLKNAIVYFPPGTYVISSTIPLPFGTQVIGDANNWPTLIASSLFIGLGVLSTDEYTGGGTGIDGGDQEYYINTANFYRQIRNLRIDITKTRATQQVACLHYQVAQATSLQNMELIAKTNTTQRAIFAENGSGGVISDITFRGGSFGIYGGNQQFTAQRLTFDGCTTGVQIIWDWGWVWKSITMTNVDVGFRLLPETKTTSKNPRFKRQAGGNNVGHIGSATFIDSSFSNVGTAVLIAPPDSKTGSGSTGIVVENVDFQAVGKAVADTSGKTLLAAPSRVDHWALGPVYSPGRNFSTGAKIGSYRRQQGLLDTQGHYFERAKPQYEDRAVGDFVHVKDFGARGDGSTDDTAAFQTALYASQGKILFIDAGSYILTGTVTVPVGSKLVGETWSQLVGSGSYFGDASKPKVMLKVGNDGDVGTVEMQDLLFTNRGPTAGLILVEWNIRASGPGLAALWDCHARIGGATGTELTPAECPAVISGIDQGCSAASLMMHITPSGSGYFENMWLWVSDHMIDDPDLNDANNTMVQNSVYVARGFLIESQQATWLYGTASEHAVYYQYNFNNAINLFAGIIQTETPYYQPTPKPPAPFEDVVGLISGDPEYQCSGNTDEFSGCDASWAVIIRGSANIFIAGAGLYSWFSTYTQDCIDDHTCQKALMLLEENYAGVRIQNLITIGAKYMAVQDGVGILAVDNLNVEDHPSWSQVSVLDVNGNGTEFQQLIWINPAIWDMNPPQFTCSPPCMVKLPPWKGATRTVDFPLITVSDNTWTSTITHAPLTITEVIFEVVTLVAAGGDARRLHKRQGFSDFWPVPATTPYWPGVVYTGPDGSATTTSLTTPFPKPPSSIGPNAPAPAQGNWPALQVRPVVGAVEGPLVDQCYFNDWSCLPGIWGDPMDDPESDQDDEGGGPEDNVICPETTKKPPIDTAPPGSSTISSTKKSTSTTTTTTSSKIPQPSPRENQLDCYDSGRGSDHTRIENAIKSFCNSLGTDGTTLSNKFFKKSNQDFPISGVEIALEIVLSIELEDGCEWRFTLAECTKYLLTPVDSCNCGGD